MKRSRSRCHVALTRRLALVLGTLLVIACESNPMGGRILFQIALEEVSGNNQNVAAGGTASAPLVVRAVDQNGTPHTGMVIAWSLTSGEGTLSAPSSVTNASGQAQVIYTSGGAPGEASVRASLDLAASGANASREVAPVNFMIGVSAAASSLQSRTPAPTFVEGTVVIPSDSEGSAAASGVATADPSARYARSG